MRLVSMLFIATATVAAAQPEWHPGTQQDGGVTLTRQKSGPPQEVLQSIYIPAVSGAPFSGTLHTEWVRPMKTGDPITFVNRRMILRDKNGRLLEERCALTPKQNGEQSLLSMLQFYDPDKHTGYDCFVMGPRHGTCELLNFYPGSPREEIGHTGPLPDNEGFEVYEDLGIREIEGIKTDGSRDTITWNPGAFGSSKESITVVREFWHSPMLGINLISILDDPRIGRQTFTLTGISLEDVDPKYFKLPDGYHVIDRRNAKGDVGSN